MVNVGDHVQWRRHGEDYEGVVEAVGNGSTSPTCDPLVIVTTASGVQVARASTLNAPDDRLW